MTPGHKPLRTSRKAKDGPRQAQTYRDPRRNADRAKGWPEATFAKTRPFATAVLIPLNRSRKWPHADSYVRARWLSRRLKEFSMSLRRLNRRIKTLAEKDKPGTIGRHITKRLRCDAYHNAVWEFHFTKGWRRRA